MTTGDHDPLMDALEALDTPPDVIPADGLDAETLRQLDALDERTVEITYPGEPIHGPDGELIGMTEPRTETATLAAPVVDDAERARLGVPAPDRDNR